MRKDYIQRVKTFDKDFIKDVIETTLRIHKKDGKAYPLRIYKSVSKRWKSVFRYKITLILNYYEFLGLLQKRLEDVDEYKERMSKFKGLFQRGNRRVYFSPVNDLSNITLGKSVEYQKFNYKQLGITQT